MVTAMVLMEVERDRVNEVAEELVEFDGVSEVYSVAGRYDLVAIIRVEDNEAMADLVTGKMLKVKGILDSETLISFRVFSKHDLEGMFSLGLE
ncbi:MAG: Lrp/AsnC family transcriptional regulator [bacterium]